MNVRVKFFAATRDIVGKNEIVLSMQEGTTIDSLLDVLTQKHPQLEKWKRYVRFAINWEYAEPSQILHNNDEVAVIPPVSGG